MAHEVKAQIITQDAIIAMADIEQALLYLAGTLDHSDGEYGLACILRKLARSVNEDVLSWIIPLNSKNVAKYQEEETE